MGAVLLQKSIMNAITVFSYLFLKFSALKLDLVRFTVILSSPKLKILRNILNVPNFTAAKTMGITILKFQSHCKKKKIR